MQDFNKYSKEQIQFYGGPIPPLLTELIKENDFKSLADFGCGDGAILFGLQQKGLLENVDDVIAVDLSPIRLDRVKQNIANIKTICGDVCCVTGIEGNKLDFVICSQVIEHVQDDTKLLREIYRVLKTGGMMYISSVIKKWYGWYFYRCNGKWVVDPTHLREYTSAQKFHALLKKNEFTILKQKLTRFKPSLGNAFNRRLIKCGIVDEGKAKEFKILRSLSRLRIPVPGYYITEAIAQK